MAESVMIDSEGFGYREDMGQNFRVTACCEAPVSCDEMGEVYCKGCYKAQPLDYLLDPSVSGS